MVWTGSRYAIAWSDTRVAPKQIYPVELDANGQITGLESPATCAGVEAYRPDLEHGGGRLALAHGDARSGNSEIYFKYLEPAAP